MRGTDWARPITILGMPSLSARYWRDKGIYRRSGGTWALRFAAALCESDQVGPVGPRSARGRGKVDEPGRVGTCIRPQRSGQGT